MVPTAERITTRIKRTTPVWMEAIVRHVLWASARKSKDIILPHSPGLKCKFHARYTISCKQQILGYLADRIAMVSEAVWAKSRIPTQSGRGFHTSTWSLRTPKTGFGRSLIVIAFQTWYAES